MLFGISLTLPVIYSDAPKAYGFFALVIAALFTLTLALLTVKRQRAVSIFLIFVVVGMARTLIEASIVRTPRDELIIIRMGSAVREILKTRIGELFNKSAPIVSGVLLGESESIGETQLELFKTFGIAHVLAVSGFHIGILSKMVGGIFPKNIPAARAAFTWFFLVLCCFITGFTPSVVRASVVGVSFMLSELVNKRHDHLSSLSLAALIILLVDPFAVNSVGFRLSFAAVFGISLFMSLPVKHNSWLLGRLFAMLAVTLSATMATSLLNIKYFGYVSTFTVLGNLIAVPVFSVLLIICAFTLAVGIPFPALGSFLSVFPDRMIMIIIEAMGKLGDIPFARIYAPAPHDLSIALLLLTLFLLSPYILRPLKKRLIIALPAFLLFTMSVVLGIISA